MTPLTHSQFRELVERAERGGILGLFHQAVQDVYYLQTPDGDAPDEADTQPIDPVIVHDGETQ